MSLIVWVTGLVLGAAPSPSPWWIGDQWAGTVWRVEQERRIGGRRRMCEEVVGIGGTFELVASQGLWILSSRGAWIEVRCAGAAALRRRPPLSWGGLRALRVPGTLHSSARRTAGGIHLITTAGVVAKVRRVGSALVRQDEGRVPGGFRLVEDRRGDLWVGTLAGSLWRKGCDARAESAFSQVRDLGAGALEALCADPAGEGVWAVCASPGRVLVHVTGSGSETQRLPLPFEVSALAVGVDCIWVTAANEPFIARRSPRGPGNDWRIQRVPLGDLRKVSAGARGGLILAARTGVLAGICGRWWSWRGGPGTVIAGAMLQRGL